MSIEFLTNLWKNNMIFNNIKFQEYSRIYDQTDTFIDQIELDKRIPLVQWCVLEKVWGAPIVFYANSKDGVFKTGNHNKFFEGNEDYYGWQEIAAKYRLAAMEMSKQVNNPIYVYGQIIGGKYRNEALGKLIQNKIQYHPFNDFLMHDIKLAQRHLPLFSVKAFSRKHSIPMVPILYVGTYDDALWYPNNKLSAVPFMFEHSAIKDNNMQGIVMKPIQDMYRMDMRVIMKSLNKQYDEKENVMSVELMRVVDFMADQGLTETRLDAAIMDVGSTIPTAIPKIAGKYVQLMFDNMNYLKYNILNKEQQKLVNKELNKIAFQKVAMLLTPIDRAA